MLFKSNNTSESTMITFLDDDCQTLTEAVRTLNPNSVRSILNRHDVSSMRTTEMHENLLHLVCSVASNDAKNYLESDILVEKGKCIIYMLIDAGFDTEVYDKKGNTCLFYAAKSENMVFCDVLLQCGANMWTNTEFNISVYEYVSKLSSVTIQETFNKYYPGLCKAVECEDIYQVRKLVNLWCRTEVCMNGISLKDIALSTGNEEIISLILGIFDSMKLVYNILAKNTKAVNEILETNRNRVRLDLRKMSDRGAPILYYLIQFEDISIIKLFIHHGCKIYSIMQDELGFDMPVLFSVLKAEASVGVVEALLPLGQPHQEEMLYKILYRGHTILEVALEKNVSLEIFDVLIDRGGPLLLCERNEVNQTVRDLALIIGKSKYVDIIDLNIFKWIQYPWKYPGRRQKMAMYGWDLELIEDEIKENVYIDEYFTHFKPLQIQIEQISEAIENGDIEKFVHLKASLCKDIENENFLWYGRVVGDGMPLLHRAVLHNRLKMVEIILAEKPPKESIDNLFDQNRRTALHYAYASVSTKAITNLLTSYGCSEHVLDKTNKEPLDFRDRQDTTFMRQLLNRLKLNDLHLPEADPWADKGPEKEAILLTIPCCHQSEEIRSEETEQHSHLFTCDSESISDFSEEVEDETNKTCIIS